MPAWEDLVICLALGIGGGTLLILSIIMLAAIL